MRASIVIPAYNVGEFIERTLDSVLPQAGENVEVVVVDDGSTDDTLAKVQAYGPRVRWFHQPNQGPSAARNKAVRLSRGEILFFFDSDDVMLPGKIERTLEIFDRHPQLGLVFTNFQTIDRDGLLLKPDFLATYATIRALDAKEGVYQIIPGRHAHTRLIEENYLGTPGVAMLRTVLDDVGGFEPDYFCGEDWDLWMRVTERYDIAYLPIKSFSYRMHGRNTSWIDPVRNYTSQIAVLARHMDRSRDEQFRRHALDKIGECYFSLAYFHYRNGDRAEARAMLNRIEAGVPRSKVWSTWLKTLLLPSRSPLVVTGQK